MNAVNLIRRLHQHRMWTNHRLLEAVRSLTDEQCRQTFVIGQGSVWKTLTHLLAAESVWLEALMGNEDPLLRGDVRGKLPGNQEGEDAIASLDDLIAEWEEVDRRWIGYLDSLTEELLDEVVYKIKTSSGRGERQRQGTKRADVLLHVCTHAQYTTAQLVNMLRHLNCTGMPETMLITMARQESGGGRAVSRRP